MPETFGAIKIRPPHRDVAPNMFIVDVDVKPPIKRVEYWVEGKKILAEAWDLPLDAVVTDREVWRGHDHRWASRRDAEGTEN